MDRRATPGEIRRAYRARARVLHPDRHGGDERAMQKLNEAWRVLSDPARRRAYDAGLGGASARRDTGGGEPGDGAGPRGTGSAGVAADNAFPAPGPGSGDALALVPAALVGAAVAVGALGVVMASPAALVLAFVLVLVALSAFVVTPILILRRDRRRLR